MVSRQLSYPGEWGAHGWDLEEELTAEFQMGAKQLPAELAAEAAGCAAKGLVLFLNETGCAYQYDPAQTSEEEHLSAQDLCLEGVDYEGNAERIVSACLDANSP